LSKWDHFAKRWRIFALFTLIYQFTLNVINLTVRASGLLAATSWRSNCIKFGGKIERENKSEKKYEHRRQTTPIFQKIVATSTIWIQSNSFEISKEWVLSFSNSFISGPCGVLLLWDRTCTLESSSRPLVKISEIYKICAYQLPTNK
jgi:hypothetical protein